MQRHFVENSNSCGPLLCESYHKTLLAFRDSCVDLRTFQSSIDQTKKIFLTSHKKPKVLAESKVATMSFIYLDSIHFRLF